MNITRGDIFYIIDDPDHPPIGSEIWPGRMGIIVSNNGLNRSSRVVEVVFLSTSVNKKLSPTHPTVTSAGKHAIALCEQIYSVDKSRLNGYVSSVPDDEMDSVNEALMFSLQINTGKNPQGIFKKFEKQLIAYPERIAIE